MTRLREKIINRLALVRGRLKYELWPQRLRAGDVMRALRAELAERVPEEGAFDALFRRWLEETPRAMRAYKEAYARGPLSDDHPLLRGRVEIFEREVDISGGINWHRDPFFGVEWPRRYMPAASDYEPGSDLVVLWHLNEMTFLLDASYGHRLTRNRALASFWVECVESWIEQNPYLVGKNWRSPMEIGTRLVVWTFGLQEIGFTHELREHQLERIISSVLQQAQHLAGHFSRKRVPNNHLIGEAATLYFVASLWPVFRDAPAWREQSERELRSEMSRQVLSDGMHFENSFNYHAYVLDFYLLYLYARCLRDGQPDGEILDGVRRLAEAFLVSRSTSGRVPRFGDESKTDFFVLRPLREMEARRHRGNPTLSEVLKPDFAEILAEVDWGRSLLSIETPETTARRFPDAGYTVFRRPTSHLVYAAGPLHKEEFSEGHLHSDAGSFELEVEGTPLFIDSGTYYYGYDAVARNHFRGATAHNRVLVDDSDPLRPEHTFAWREVPRARQTWYSADAAVGAVASMQRVPSRGPEFHHERVLVQSGDAWVIVDRLRRVVKGKEILEESTTTEPHGRSGAHGASESEAVVRFHTPLAATAIDPVGENSLRIRVLPGVGMRDEAKREHDPNAARGFRLTGWATSAYSCEVVSDRVNPLSWYSRWYGDLQIGSTIEGRIRVRDDAVIVHVLTLERSPVEVRSIEDEHVILDIGASDAKRVRLEVHFDPLRIEFGGRLLDNRC